MKIDVNRNDDIRYWAARFGVSRAQLIAAIAAAGPRVEDVEARLRRERMRRDDELQMPPSRRPSFHAYD
jgi:hypothetical protein